MESRVRLLGHPLHQMLVVFPLGLLGTSVIFDAIHLWNRTASSATVAYALIASGLIGGLIAAPWGPIDWLAIPRHTRAKMIGALHGGGNVIVLALFACSWWLRQGRQDDPPGVAIVLSLCGLGIALVTGWVGGELVDRLGVGVSAHANLDARSSLDGPAEPPLNPPERGRPV